MNKLKLKLEKTDGKIEALLQKKADLLRKIKEAESPASSVVDKDTKIQKQLMWNSLLCKYSLYGNTNMPFPVLKYNFKIYILDPCMTSFTLVI